MIFIIRSRLRLAGVHLFQWAFFLQALLCNTCAQTTSFQYDANGNLTAQFSDAGLAPRIIGQPQSQLSDAGSNARFTVVLVNPVSATFQWRFNDSDIIGAKGPTLVLKDVGFANEGDYSVVVTNPSGSVTSEPAKLWIDTDNDDMGDSWEIVHFGDLSANATRDTDGDGLSNQREFQDGTDPNDPNSARYRLLIVREGGSVLRNPDQASYDNGQRVTLSVIPSGNEVFHAWLGDIVSRDNPVTFAMNKDMTVLARFSPIRFIWTNAVAGAWENPTNWTPRLSPGFADSVVITNGVVVTLNTNAICTDVTLGRSTFTTLAGSGDLTILDNFDWTAGTLGGTGRTVLDTNALLTIRNQISLSGRVLENRGTIVWEQGNFWSVVGGALISNAPTGTLRFQSIEPSIVGGGIASGRFDNQGLMEFMDGSASLTVSKGLFFSNAGTLNLSTHSLILEGGFANDGRVTLLPAGNLRIAGGGSGSGSFQAPAGSNVEWTGGEFRFTGAAQFDGEGLYRIANSSVLLVNTEVTIPNLELSIGTLGGSGTVVVGKAMNWTGGTMAGPGKTIVPDGAMLTMNSLGSVGLSARRIENAGTIQLKGDRFIGMAFGSILTNRPGALVELQGIGVSSVGGENWIDNAGILRIAGEATVRELNSSVNNFGTIEVASGSVLWNGVVNNAGTVRQNSGTTNRFAGGGSLSGTMDVPFDALVEWIARSFTLVSGARLDGEGLFRLNGIGARFVGNGDVQVQNFDLANASSTLEGTGLLQIQRSMNWVGGTMEGTGRTVVLPGAQLNVVGANSITLHRVLENAGSVRWSGPGIWILLNSIVTNRAGALFEAQNDSRFAFGGGLARFDNAGTFRKSGSTGVTDFAFPIANTGTVDIRSGILAAKAGFTSTKNATLMLAIGGTSPGTGFGQLQVTGPVAVDGKLQLEFLDGFVPELGTSFPLVTAGSRSGAYSTFLYPEGSVVMELTNTPNTVVARVIEPILNPLVLFPPVVTESTVVLSWSISPNRSYQLEFSDDLEHLDWQVVPGQIIVSGDKASATDARPVANRFYRVRMLP